MNKFNRKNLYIKLKGVKIFTDSNFKDKRGILWTSWNKLKLNKINFNHDKFSLSKKMFLEDFIMIIRLGN